MLQDAQQRNVPDIISEDDLVPIPISQADYELMKQGFKRYRDLLICKLLRATGLRIAEFLRATPAHFKEHGPNMYFLIKRGKQRGKPLWDEVYLHPELAMEVKNYIAGNGIGHSRKIFQITSRRVEQVFREVSLKMLGHAVHPHQMRHLYVKTLIDGGVPVDVAAKMVGHTSGRTTTRWYYDLSREQRAEIQRRIPI